MPPLDPSIKFTIRFEHKVNVWVLQLGGWLPLQFASVDVLVIDRNIRSTLAAIQRSPESEALAGDRWWLEHLNRPVPALNAFLCAMEGRWRTPPSFPQFCEELAKANAFLEAALPKASVLRHKPEDFARLYEVVTSQLSRLARETDFLLEVCPLIALRTASGRERPVEARILAAADRTAVSRQSLCYMAALSTLYEPLDGAEPRIGRGVLKPTATYTSNDAFNALADIRSLEVLAAGCDLGSFSAGMCTRDKYLAAFWVNLGVHSPGWSGSTFKASCTPKPDLFPRLSNREFAALLARLHSDV